MKKLFLALFVISLLFISCYVASATEVSKDIHITDDTSFHRSSSLEKVGNMFYLFYTKTISPDPMDARFYGEEYTYSLYYKNATSIENLINSDEVYLSDSTQFPVYDGTVVNSCSIYDGDETGCLAETQCSGYSNDQCQGTFNTSSSINQFSLSDISTTIFKDNLYIFMTGRSFTGAEKSVYYFKFNYTDNTLSSLYKLVEDSAIIPGQQNSSLMHYVVNQVDVKSNNDTMFVAISTPYGALLGKWNDTDYFNNVVNIGTIESDHLYNVELVLFNDTIFTLGANSPGGFVLEYSSPLDNFVFSDSGMVTNDYGYSDYSVTIVNNTLYFLTTYPNDNLAYIRCYTSNSGSAGDNWDSGSTYTFSTHNNDGEYSYPYGYRGSNSWQDGWAIGYSDGNKLYVIYSTRSNNYTLAPGNLAYFTKTLQANQHFTSLQQATASSSDNIYLDNQTYNEGVGVFNQISIYGYNATLSSPIIYPATLKVFSSNVYISGLNVQGIISTYPGLSNVIFNLSSPSNFSLDSPIVITSSGIVELNGVVNTTRPNINSIFTISDNFIGLDSNTYPEYNLPANLTLDLTGHNINTPRILRNGVECVVPQCIIDSYASNIIKFRVSGFSNYTIQDVPYQPLDDNTNAGLNNTKNTLYAAFALIAIMILAFISWALISAFRGGNTDLVTVAVVAIAGSIVVIIAYVIIWYVFKALGGT